MKIHNASFRTFYFTVIALSLLGLQCKAKQEAKAEEEKPVMEKMDMSGPEYTSLYICPMHCKGSGSDHAGVCPSCGMDYVMNESAQAPAKDTSGAK